LALPSTAPSRIAPYNDIPTKNTRDIGINTVNDESIQTDSHMMVSPIQICAVLVHIFMDIFSCKTRNIDDVAKFVSNAMDKVCDSDTSVDGIMKLIQRSSDGRVD
jgi:hypothetical protein